MRQHAPLDLRGARASAVRGQTADWLVGRYRRATLAPPMASGTNPDLHVWRSDWFGHFVSHLFEMS
jgi:hypothetical protein